jgi:hypothetical protein
LDILDKIGLAAAVMLPLWNIPLIVRMIKRKSSRDISLYWAFGVWTCLLGMFPSGLHSPAIVWKTFNIVNLFFFTGVVVTAVVYRRS